MSRYGLWNEAFELAGANNIKLGVIDPKKETIAGSDTTHAEACATRGKKKNKCAHCPFLAECLHPQPTDNTAGVENRGILLVNKQRQAVCISEQKMVFVSRDLKKQTYIWGCPFYHLDVTSDKTFTAKEKYKIIEEYKYSRDLKGTAKRHHQKY